MVHGVAEGQRNGCGRGIAEELQGVGGLVGRKFEFLGEEVGHEPVGLVEYDQVYFVDPQSGESEGLFDAFGYHAQAEVEHFHSVHVEVFAR